MPCLFVLFAAFAPRLLLVFMWLARPNLMDQAFETFIIPLLGFIFLPFTTLMWVLLWAGSGGNVTGFDWVWIGIAVLLDVGHYVGGAANRRGMSTSSASSPAMAAAPTMSSTSGAPMSAPVTPPAPSPAPTPEAAAPPAPSPAQTPGAATPPAPTAEAAPPDGEAPQSA